jgi:hypothetical protein
MRGSKRPLKTWRINRKEGKNLKRRGENFPENN